MKTVLDFIEKDCPEFAGKAFVDDYVLYNDLTFVSEWSFEDCVIEELKIPHDKQTFTVEHDLKKLVNYMTNND